MFRRVVGHHQLQNALPRPQLVHKPHTPAFRPFATTAAAMAQQYRLKGVANLSIAEGEMQEAEVEGIEEGKVLLLNSQGKIHATSPKCTHYGAPLKNGVLSSDGRLTCPWHGGRIRQVAQRSRRTGADRRAQLVSMSAAEMSRTPLRLTRLPSSPSMKKTGPCTSKATRPQ